MSGVYIKGMYMPDKLTAVWVYPDGTALVFADDGNDILHTTVVPVPDHGDLIDRQELEAKMKTRSWYIGRASDPDCLVVDAPTVIPTDKEEP